MAVKEILDRRVIDLDMNAENKDQVIRHLAGPTMWTRWGSRWAGRRI